MTWPSSNLYRHLIASARAAAERFHAASREHGALLERLGSPSVTLIGEASHGTQDFYHLRASITKHLIEHQGSTAVAVEADWPDAYRVNRFVRGEGGDGDANSALSGFERFPSWMWRNTEVLSFVRWLREWNDRHPKRKVGFYGLDLYSLSTSIQAVITYLDKVDPDAARRARDRYACFDHFAGDTHAYGYAVSAGITEPCEREVVQQLAELRKRAAEYASRDGELAEDEFFFAEQNARLAANAEEYYRAMFRGRHSSWNIRDTHMADTFDALMAFLGQRNGVKPRIAVWAHNSHLGDARATEMGERGELNLGQLLRERHGAHVKSIGFTTYDGTVTAASDWDGAGRAQSRPSGARRIDRGLAARCRHPAVLAAPRRSAAGGLRHAIARTRDWCNLSTADRAPEPLFPGPRDRAVRRADSRRSVDRARATRALLPLVARRSSRDLSHRSLRGGHV